MEKYTNLSDSLLEHKCNHFYICRKRTTHARIVWASTFHNSCIPKSIHDWNLLNNDVKEASSADAFTRALNKDLANAPKWYSTGDRDTSIVHARMRMLCSKLNDHLFSHIHVIDSPACQCGHDRENNKHFLIDCPLYNNERAVLVNELATINFKPTVSNLLYGNIKYTEKTNIQAFGYIQNFIRSTTRFD